jgi:hypothetical protein
MNAWVLVIAIAVGSDRHPEVIVQHTTNGRAFPTEVSCQARLLEWQHRLVVDQHQPQQNFQLECVKVFK